MLNIDDFLLSLKLKYLSSKRSLDKVLSSLNLKNKILIVNTIGDFLLTNDKIYYCEKQFPLVFVPYENSELLALDLIYKDLNEDEIKTIIFDVSFDDNLEDKSFWIGNNGKRIKVICLGNNIYFQDEEERYINLPDLNGRYTKLKEEYSIFGSLAKLFF